MGDRLIWRHLRRSGWLLGPRRLRAVSRGEVWRERKANEDFAEKEREAVDMAGMSLHDDAVRRATIGELRYKYTSAGKIILHPKTGNPYVERVCSDRLLIWMLKHHRPEKYEDKVQPKTKGRPT